MSASPIAINSIADLKRALMLPGITVFVDRNDHLSGTLVRDPAA